MTAAAGRFFEDFELGQKIWHATPRTLTEADATLYLALTGARFILACSAPFARANGLKACPLDDLLVFNTVFGKSVPDVSRNAVANLGYAEGRFAGFVYPGETLVARSTVIGLKETSSGEAGIVWVRTRGYREDGSAPLEYVRWVLVAKRTPGRPTRAATVPTLRPFVPAEDLSPPEDLRFEDVSPVRTGSARFLDDYAVGERIDHVDGMGVTEGEHRLATRLYQNTARVHFDDHAARQGKLGTCIVYGGHVISIARALSFEGLGNAQRLLAINAGTHANPCVAGDTVFAWSEVLDVVRFPGRGDAGALRLRLVATRNRPCHDFPLRDDAGRHLPEVLLELDYWALLPRRR